jgi:hypothetical protein
MSKKIFAWVLILQDLSGDQVVIVWTERGGEGSSSQRANRVTALS